MVRNTSRGAAQPSDVFFKANARAYQKHVLHGQKTVSIFIANLHAIFNDILRKNHGDSPLLSPKCGITTVSESVMGRVLNFSQTDWIDLNIFCHITLERSWILLAFVYVFVECTLPRQSTIANQVFHKRQRKLIDVIYISLRDDFSYDLFQNDTNGWR